MTPESAAGEIRVFTVFAVLGLLLMVAGAAAALAAWDWRLLAITATGFVMFTVAYAEAAEAWDRGDAP